VGLQPLLLQQQLTEHSSHCGDGLLTLRCRQSRLCLCAWAPCAADSRGSVNPTASSRLVAPWPPAVSCHSIHLSVLDSGLGPPAASEPL
jgi:hypothetical protein